MKLVYNNLDHVWGCKKNQREGIVIIMIDSCKSNMNYMYGSAAKVSDFIRRLRILYTQILGKDGPNKRNLHSA